MVKFRAKFTGLLFTLMLAACGGGGGGGSFGVAFQPLAIDGTNAMQVTGAVLDASGFVVDVGNPGGPITGVVVQGNDEQVDVAKVVRSHVDLFSVLSDQNAAALVSGVVLPAFVLDCTAGGTVTISGEIADDTLPPMTLTPGDTLNAVFKNCNDGDGLVLNGTMKIVVASLVMLDQDPNSDFLLAIPYDFIFDATLTNLSITELATSSTFTTNGDMTLEEATSDRISFKSKIWGNSLSIRTPVTSDTLQDFLILSTLDFQNVGGAIIAYTFNSGGDTPPDHLVTACCATLGSTALGGSVDFETLLTFAGAGDNYPSVGQMEITGATVAGGIAPSSVHVTAVDSQCVQLEVDPDGKGITDVIVTTWASLPTGIKDSSTCP